MDWLFLEMFRGDLRNIFDSVRVIGYLAMGSENKISREMNSELNENLF